METIHESGGLADALTEDELKQLAKSERMAVHVSNIANLFLFMAKVYASIESRSLAVIASTMDSFLDLLSGLILWFTSYAMRNPNQYYYPIGKKRMQPVGIIVFASVMATLGLQIILESVRQLIAKSGPTDMTHEKEMWMIGIMVSVTVVKFLLMLYCRRFKNDIVRAYAQDHFFDVITNSVGLVTAVLAIRFYWWIDPTGAIIIAVYTINTWAKTVVENVWSLIGRTAPPDFLAKLTYLIWNHHKEIQHIDTVRAYTFGSHYFVEVDIVLPQDMMLSQAHNIGETLQEKLEQLPEVERAFVHIDFEFTHRPEHNNKTPPHADVVKSLKNGIAVNLLGTGAAILGMQATIGLLVAKAPTTSSTPYYQGIPPGNTPVLALDVFLVQILRICRHHTFTFPRASVLLGAVTLIHIANIRTCSHSQDRVSFLSQAVW
ncbi:metal tolerance protein 10 [Phtheirospermum japonicum]|uniref:Metal tolerance protein 10 n=1 Tax=Phtheirospermum japonicum TaxID=374723 RepID=A0A830BI22_9LAMI|nr:metal tolerance protein 10 [Phtheirospermum japonicum]